MEITLIRCIVMLILVNGGGKSRYVVIFLSVINLILSQVALEKKLPGTTVIPVFLSSDNTQLTLFCGKMAYPLYLTIGNLPKEIRRKPSSQSQIFLAYLPTTKLEHIDSIASRCRAVSNLYHTRVT
jgi:hypothetical protein